MALPACLNNVVIGNGGCIFISTFMEDAFDFDDVKTDHPIIIFSTFHANFSECVKHPYNIITTGTWCMVTLLTPSVVCYRNYAALILLATPYMSQYALHNGTLHMLVYSPACVWPLKGLPKILKNHSELCLMFHFTKICPHTYISTHIIIDCGFILF